MNTAPTTAVARKPLARRPRRLAQWLTRLCLLGIVGLIIAEIVLRFGVGLGDPPIYELDEDVEYMLAPSRTYRRFGNMYSVNSFSMRSPEFAPSRTDADELRILVIGDSIVNGGGAVNQPDLATEQLRSILEGELKRPVIVGNISAGSWGPPNQLAFTRTFGTFDADIVFHVLNSMDIDDVPGNEGLGPQWPRRSPVLAIQEAIENYGVRLLERVSGKRFTPAPIHIPNPAQDAQTSLQAVRDLATSVRAAGGTYVMVNYLTRAELSAAPHAGYAKFVALAADMNVPRIETGAAFRDSIARGVDPFVPNDDVHAGRVGQRLLAESMSKVVREVVNRRADQDAGQQPPPEGPKSPTN